MAKEKDKFTAGEFASLAGVSSRTIRYYDKLGLLHPIGYTEKNYRLYDKTSLAQLQQILVLKYIGMPLEDISRIMKSRKEISIKELLMEQQEILVQKRDELNQIISVLEETCNYCTRMNREPDTKQISKTIKLFRDNKKSEDTFVICEKYGKNQWDWYPWFFRQMELKPGEKVLEVGSGYGRIWTKNFKQIPENTQIVLMDKCQYSLGTVQRFVQENKGLLQAGVSFSFEHADVNEADLGIESFDCIAAFNMWSYVENRSSYLGKIVRALKKHGRMCASINWLDDVRDFEKLLSGFSPKLDIRPCFEKHQNYIQAVEKDFLKYFSNVEYRHFENEIHISNKEDLYQLLRDRTGVGEDISSYGEVFIKYLDKYLKKEGEVVVHAHVRMMVGVK